MKLHAATAVQAKSVAVISCFLLIICLMIVGNPFMFQMGVVQHYSILRFFWHPKFEPKPYELNESHWFELHVVYMARVPKKLS